MALERPPPQWEQMSGAMSQTMSDDRTPRAIPLHLLATSMQEGGSASSSKISRGFHVPALDGGRSPFGGHDLIPRMKTAPPLGICTIPPTPRRTSSLSDRGHSPDLDASFSPTPQQEGKRRPYPHLLRPPRDAICKLPLIGPQLPAEALESGEMLSEERGCQTAPAARWQPEFFAPVPPMDPKTPRTPNTPSGHVRQFRRRCLSARSGDDQTPKTPCDMYMTCETSPTPPTRASPGDGTKKSGDCTRPVSTKSAHSDSTNADDLPELHSVTPQEYTPVNTPIETPSGGTPAIDTPAGGHMVSTGSSKQTAGQTASSSSRSRKSVAFAPGALRWRKGEKIGAGSHGAVYKAQNMTNGQLFVVKESIVNAREYQENLQRELEICRDLEHPNIVKYLGHEYCDQSNLYVHLEYVPGGSLRSMLLEFGPFEQDLMKVAMRNLLEGLEYLHSRSPPVVHRDIKSANVLVGQDFCMKLADFGCSKCDDTTTSFTTMGSVLWMAPEVIRGAAGGHGRKADVWSLGCVFIEMATAETPWGSRAFDNIWQAMKHIEGSDKTPHIPEVLTEVAHDLIGRCVCRDPIQRASAAELLAHGFLQSIQ